MDGPAGLGWDRLAGRPPVMPPPAAPEPTSWRSAPGGPWAPLNDTEAMLGRGAGARAALAVSMGRVARARAAVAAASSAATGRHRAGLWLAGGWVVMAGSFRCWPVLVWPRPGVVHM